jgi:transcriptional regulator with XRE-family HTH domain
MDPSVLGDRIRRHRRATGQSQNELAAAAGVASSYVSRFEGGRRRPSVDLLERIAAALEVDVDELLYGPAVVSAEEVAAAAAAWLAHPAEAGSYARLVELVRGWDASQPTRARAAAAQKSPAASRVTAGL